MKEETSIWINKANEDFREVEFPRTHDLLLLLDEFILKIDGSFVEIKDFAASLNGYYIISGYPGYDDIIDLQVARDAFNATKMIRMFILQRIGKG